MTKDINGKSKSNTVDTGRDTRRKRWFRMEWSNKGRAWKSEKRQRVMEKLLSFTIKGDDRAMNILAEFAANGGRAVPVRGCANR